MEGREGALEIHENGAAVFFLGGLLSRKKEVSAELADCGGVRARVGNCGSGEEIS